MNDNMNEYWVPQPETKVYSNSVDQGILSRGKMKNMVMSRKKSQEKYNSQEIKINVQ